MNVITSAGAAGTHAPHAYRQRCRDDCASRLRSTAGQDPDWGAARRRMAGLACQGIWRAGPPTTYAYANDSVGRLVELDLPEVRTRLTSSARSHRPPLGHEEGRVARHTTGGSEAVTASEQYLCWTG